MATKRMKQRAVTPDDAIRGQKIRARRLEVEMSQDMLAKKLGVSFQQVQKYEKGVNRVSAGRLELIGKALDVNMSYFTDQTTRSESALMSMLGHPVSQRLIKAFDSIPDMTTKYKITALVESIAAHT